MGKLTREDVLKLARLSRLRLSEAEVGQFTQELSNILEYVEVLNGVDVTGLEPTYQVSGLKNVTRPDETKEYQATLEALLKNAPAVTAGQFKVKRVIG